MSAAWRSRVHREFGEAQTFARMGIRFLYSLIQPLYPKYAKVTLLNTGKL
nr:MAG TPA: hypothetical protein [Microviridae sp.]